MRRASFTATLVVLLLLGACSDDGATSPDLTTATATTRPSPHQATVAALADDALEGRDNRTSGSVLAQRYLVDQLSEFAEPLSDDFRQTFVEGTNILAVIPGAELPDEFVILGAHYDHLGRDCFTTESDDDICNGATDNAAGVAAVLEIGRRLADEPPRRSVVLAFWDAEEDGLLGSTAYLTDPAVPLAQTTLYVNWDIQGANLLPSLASTTLVIGAETGGRDLVQAAARAAADSVLDPLALSSTFGRDRSDHAGFIRAGVPTVFFTDSSAGCYHTAQDDTSVVDLDKLGHQITLGEALVRDQAGTDKPPTFVAVAPGATYDDAHALLAIVRRSEPDVDRLPEAGRAFLAPFLDNLVAIADAGPEAFDDHAATLVISGATELSDLLAASDCHANAG
jgi:hypothetical protein